MSGWIKVEKDLSNDPHVLTIASRLRHADVTLGSRSRLVVIGALVTLWWYADTHIRDDDVLPIGADQINELVGIENFCQFMPTDWLKILDANSVQLIDYCIHNGTTAKKRALDQRRQQRHRSNDNAQVTPPSRKRHANTVTRPRPREDLDQEKDKNTSASATPTQTAVSRGTSDDDPDWFLHFKLAYPARAGDQGWRKALKASRARQREGHTTAEFLAGASRYAAFCEAAGKVGTEYVKQAATFLGPDKPFLLPWHAPPKAENASQRILRHLDRNDDSRVIDHEPERQSLPTTR